MMFIEFFGLVGAGKSTVARATQESLLEVGYDAIDLKTAIDRRLERSLLGRLAQPFLAPGPRRRLLKAIYQYGLYPAYGLRLALANPALFAAAVRGQLGNGLPWWHKRKIWRLLFNQVIGQAFVAGRLLDKEIVLLEEGPLHRSVNLFAWQMDGPRTDLVAQYLEHLPRLDLVILVEAPLDRCRQRAADRGLPSRLRHKDEETAQVFFENAAQIVDQASAYIESSGRSYIVVDNSGPPGEFVAGLGRQLESTLFAPEPIDARPALA